MVAREQALLGSLGYCCGAEDQSTGAPREGLLAGYANVKSFPHSALVSNIQWNEVKACVDSLFKIMCFFLTKSLVHKMQDETSLV